VQRELILENSKKTWVALGGKKRGFIKAYFGEENPTSEKGKGTAKRRAPSAPRRGKRSTRSDEVCWQKKRSPGGGGRPRCLHAETPLRQRRDSNQEENSSPKPKQKKGQIPAGEKPAMRGGRPLPTRDWGGVVPAKVDARRRMPSAKKEGRAPRGGAVLGGAFPLLAGGKKVVEASRARGGVGNCCV